MASLIYLDIIRSIGITPSQLARSLATELLDILAMLGSYYQQPPQYGLRCDEVE